MVAGIGIVTVVATPTPAVAETTQVTAATLAYTDSRDPRGIELDSPGPAPVGAWRDEQRRRHVSRSYFTFDLSAWRGRQIRDAVVVADETAVDDCRKPRRVEVSRTRAVTARHSWQNPPDVLTRLGEFDAVSAGCPAAGLTLDVTTAVRAVLAGGGSTLTLELRVPGEAEGDPHLGRAFARDLGILIESNTAPHTPVALMVGDTACGTPGALLTNSHDPELSAELGDPDGDDLYATFAVWPIADPADRRLFRHVGPATPDDTRARLRLPWDLLADGRYAFAVKARDEDSATPWSSPCRFTVDTTAPTGDLRITSTDYPDDGAEHGGGGVGGSFTITLTGVPDLAGFLWGVEGPYTFVPAGPGGTATVTYTPDRAGPTWLSAVAVDRAGNFSETANFRFLVADNAPLVTDADPDAWSGQPHHLTFTPAMSGVVSYAYQVDYGPEQTLAAAADGSARLVFTPDKPYTDLLVRSVTASGVRSSPAALALVVVTAPVVGSTDWPRGAAGAPFGSTGTFTLRPHTAGVVEYVYQFDFGPSQTVPAGPDGTATVTFTPTRAYDHTLIVRSRTAAGAESDATYYSFQVPSVAPEIDGHGIGLGETGGRIGDPLPLTFRPRADGVTEYLYRVNEDAEATVAAGADGSATVTLLPLAYAGMWTDVIRIEVRSRSTGGFVSDPATFWFYLDPTAPVVTASTVGDRPLVGQPMTFEFTARIGGQVEFRYVLDGVEQSLAAGPDGHATLVWTPQTPDLHTLWVGSRNSDGLVTGQTPHHFFVFAD